MRTFKSTLLYKTLFAVVALLWLPLYMNGQVAADKYDLLKIAKNEYTISSDADNKNCPYDSLCDGNNSKKWTAGRPGTVNLEYKFNNEVNVKNIYFNLSNIENWVKPQYINVYIRNSNDEWKIIKKEEVTRTLSAWTVSLDESVATKNLRLECIPKEQRNTLIIPEISLDKRNGFYNDKKIQYKSAKWFDLVKDFNLSPSVLGSFSYDEPRFDAIMSNDQKIQATHTYIDTIYMHKGEKITLALPTKSTTGYASSSSAQTYQRWYSYRTDGTFETNHKTSTSGKTVYDLLTPNTGNPSGGVPAYRFENGYVGRPMGAILQAMDFYYPTDQEFKDWFPNTKVDNNWFVVACDVSGYTDFSEHFTSKGSTGQSLQSLTRDFEKSEWFEPTLSVRVIFYIVGVDERPENDSESWKNGHGRLEQTEFQTSGDNAKYLEEYDITFPNKHLSNHTNELVAISKDARSYAIPDATDDNDNLDLAIESKAPDDATGLLSLSKTSLTGINRVIQFFRTGKSGQP